MKVVLCVKDAQGAYRVTAYGQLNVTTTDLEEIKGQQVKFSLEKDFGDFPFLKCPPRCAKGVLTNTAHRNFYEFVVVEGEGKQGWLRINARVSVLDCLSASA